MSDLNPIHFADGWEAIADAVPQAPALMHGELVRSWAEFDSRAARLAEFLRRHGIGRDAKVAIYLPNRPEYLEAHFAALKIRAVPINVNYRYEVPELRYLLDNADARALVFDARYADKVAQLTEGQSGELVLVQVDTETAPTAASNLTGHGYENVIAAHEPCERIERDPEDLYMFYTGGTTGMPKGVMYHCGTLQSAFLRAFDRLELPHPASPSELADAIRHIHAKALAPVALPACPLMHATGLWIGALGFLNLGGAVVTLPQPSLDARALLQTVQQRRVTNLIIVGDAFARPILEELEQAQASGDPYDVSSLKGISSSGAMWSREVKAALSHFTSAVMRDVIGSTEGGMGSSESAPQDTSSTATFTLNDGVAVFDENDQPVVPGSGIPGRIATSSMVPVGYYKDPEKSAATFREVGGVRYSFPGDWATVETDGRITLLGRGSATINTAGEKVYPEEVEEALKRHQHVVDCLVIGMPDERFGQKVVAVVSTTGQVSDTELMEAARGQLAGYKLPKAIYRADSVVRSPSGKPDYQWARQLVEAADDPG